MKKIVFATALLSAVMLTGCGGEPDRDSNPVVQASEYVSAESEMLGDIGDSAESRLADADRELDEIL